MELLDTLTILVWPGAMDAGLGDLLFWGSLAIALFIAFWAAFPVNRWLIARGKGHAVVMEHHHARRRMSPRPRRPTPPTTRSPPPRAGAAGTVARDAAWALLDAVVGGGARVAVVGAGNGDDLPLGAAGAPRGAAWT